MFDILATGLRFPEGPAFAPDGALWGVELKGGSLFRWEDGAMMRFAVGGGPNGLAFQGDRLWVCDSAPEAGAVRAFAPDSGARTVVEAAGGRPLQGPNDLAVDPGGGLVFTCPGDSRATPTGEIWRRAPDGGITAVASGLRFPNGLAFSPDGHDLVVAETYLHRLWRGRWDAAEGHWIDPEPWVEVGGPIGPDGMAFDATGRLYVAIFGQGRIAVIAPDGRIESSFATPGAWPTNVAFDPSGRLGLVVTEAERGELLSLPTVRY